MFDNLTLTRADLPWAQAALGGYLLLAAAGFAYLTLRDGGWLAWFFALAAPFALGNLFSGFTVFFWRSGSLSVSWPFLLLVIGILLGNEFLKKFYAQLIFRALVLFAAAYFFFIFYLPTALGRLNAWVFALAGLVSLAFIVLYLYLLGRARPALISAHRRSFTLAIGAFFVIINLFYFTNILPPIPLALKDAGIYQRVERQNNNYLASAEIRPWYQRWRRYPIIHYQPGQALFAYGAVFAPTRLNTTIAHEWQYYHPPSAPGGGEWQTRARISIGIVGGRDGGYRGYSITNNLAAGYWRVNIITARGQVIGRIKFLAQPTDQPLNLRSLAL